jgi:hypothetical protein
MRPPGLKHRSIIESWNCLGVDDPTELGHKEMRTDEGRLFHGVFTLSANSVRVATDLAPELVDAAA